MSGEMFIKVSAVAPTAPGQPPPEFKVESSAKLPYKYIYSMSLVMLSNAIHTVKKGLKDDKSELQLRETLKNDLSKCIEEALTKK